MSKTEDVKTLNEILKGTRAHILVTRKDTKDEVGIYTDLQGSGLDITVLLASVISDLSEKSETDVKEILKLIRATIEAENEE